MSDIRTTEAKTLLAITLTLLVCVLAICYLSPSVTTTTMTFKSHHVPYIPRNLQLKDKDNKVMRHLKFRFIYTCSADVFNQVVKASSQINNVKELFSFKKDDDLWVGFFVVETENITIPSYIANQITEYPYKLYDTYVMGETRIFNDIEDILVNQGYDRDAYGESSISTTYLNEICSNKMEYIRYFVKHGLMVGTSIEPYRRDAQNEYPGMYVKAPYSSRSACAALNKIDSDLCYLADGVIVQEENKTLGKYELKCYVIDGKIVNTLVRMNGKNYNVCVPEDLSGVSSEVAEMVTEYKDKFEETCLKTYYYTNALINMRLAKLDHETKEAESIIEDLKQTIQNDTVYPTMSESEYARIKYILTGLVNTVKHDLITQLNTTYDKEYDVSSFTRLVVDYPDPLESVSTEPFDSNKFIEAASSIKIHDRFMRVDMALPDNGSIDIKSGKTKKSTKSTNKKNSSYDKITVTEIEPLASGIYLYKTIGACLRDDEMNTFDNIVKYNLYSIISSDPQYA